MEVYLAAIPVLASMLGKIQGVGTDFHEAQSGVRGALPVPLTVTGSMQSMQSLLYILDF